ncbi:MAG: T9SS type A sorting domain-containing protein [Ignavibacteria bacterium]|nr:T9SS type A sorting domain-containing protein [Ignavibacteria bacterium]
MAIGVWADNNGFVYAAGDGGGPNNNRDYIALKLSKTTGVEETNLTVNNFSLSQNYPNPFNPSTKISWQSPVSGHQSLKVYDVLGDEVATLLNEEKAAGTYEVTFNAAAATGGLASGIYFYRLTAGNFIETKKMILLK